MSRHRAGEYVNAVEAHGSAVAAASMRAKWLRCGAVPYLTKFKTKQVTMRRSPLCSVSSREPSRRRGRVPRPRLCRFRQHSRRDPAELLKLVPDRF